MADYINRGQIDFIL